MTLDKDTIVILGALAAQWGTIITAIAVLKYQVKRMEKDIDGIAEFIGTPRALARKKK